VIQRQQQSFNGHFHDTPCKSVTDCHHSGFCLSKDDGGGGDRDLLQITQQRVVKTFISPRTTVLQHDTRCITKITNLNSYYNSDQSLWHKHCKTVENKISFTVWTDIDGQLASNWHTVINGNDTPQPVSTWYL